MVPRVLKIGTLLQSRVSGRVLQPSLAYSSNTTESSSQNDTSHDSYEEVEEKNLQDKILEASLPFVHVHGWSSSAIGAGAESLGYSQMTDGLFKSGGTDLVNYFFRRNNAELERQLKEKTESTETQQSTQDFLREAAESRLLMNAEYIDTWSQALAKHAFVTNASNAIDNYGTLVDHIWYYAGDRSHDIRWYQKRLALGAIYKTTELCMIQDKSEGFQETWGFLDRRLKEMNTADRLLCSAGSAAKDVKKFARGGFLTGLNVLGFNEKSR